MATDRGQETETAAGRRPVAVIALLTIVLSVGGAALGYFVGAARAPTSAEAASARAESRVAASREPSAASFESGRGRGATEGAKAGRSRGRKLGRRRGAAAAAKGSSTTRARRAASQTSPP